MVSSVFFRARPGRAAVDDESGKEQIKNQHAMKREARPLPPLSRWRASPLFALAHLQARGGDRHLYVLLGDLDERCCCVCLGGGRRVFVMSSRHQAAPSNSNWRRFSSRRSLRAGPRKARSRSETHRAPRSEPTCPLTIARGERDSGEGPRRGARAPVMTRNRFLARKENVGERGRNDGERREEKHAPLQRRLAPPPPT